MDEHVVITQSPWFILLFTLGIVYCMELDKFMMICTHAFSVVQKRLSWKHFVLYIVIPCPNPLEALILLLPPQFFLFQNAGIIQYVAFSY